LDFQPQLWGFPLFFWFLYCFALRLVAVGQATHTGHHAQHVVVHGVHAHLSRAARANRVDGDRELQRRLVDTAEVAGATGLVLLRLEREGVHVDARGRRASVVLVRLHAVEVPTLALREPILSVELQLGNLHGVLARALDARVQDDLGQQVVGGRSEHLLTLVAARVQPRRTAQRRTECNTNTRQVRTRGAITRSGRHNTATRLARIAKRAAREHVHHDALRGEVIRVVERLAAIHLCDEIRARGAVNKAVALDNPHELLHRVVEVQLDLVGGRGDALRTRELQLLNQVLVGLLGKPAALLSVQVDVVNVQGRSRQGLDRRGRGRGAGLLVVAAVDPLLELHVDAHLVVLERNQRDCQARVTAEPELQRDVQRLRRGARARSARVGQLRTGARGIQGVTLGVLHQHQVVRVADHVVEGRDGARILGQLGPDLHPVTILAVDALATNLELHNLDQAVADVVQPAEAVQVGAASHQVHGGENHLDVRAVHQIRIAVDDCRHALVKVRLAIEGDLNGLHGEVRVPLVQQLPERDLGVAGNVDVLRTIAYELKKTATHFVCVSWRENLYRRKHTCK
jgi:hypothetical protein